MYLVTGRKLGQSLVAHRGVKELRSLALQTFALEDAVKLRRIAITEGPPYQGRIPPSRTVRFPVSGSRRLPDQGNPAHPVVTGLDSPLSADFPHGAGER